MRQQVIRYTCSSCGVAAESNCSSEVAPPAPYNWLWLGVRVLGEIDAELLICGNCRALAPLPLHRLEDIARGVKVKAG